MFIGKEHLEKNLVAEDESDQLKEIEALKVKGEGRVKEDLPEEDEETEEESDDEAEEKSDNGAEEKSDDGAEEKFDDGAEEMKSDEDGSGKETGKESDCEDDEDYEPNETSHDFDRVIPVELALENFGESLDFKIWETMLEGIELRKKK
uniref:Uncharacterized protein n=1 Tax=Sphaerodactylus townsendi TaxID=933632 RepID=A0ACB8FLK6_9SAUR